MSDQLRYTIDADDGPLKQALRNVEAQFKGVQAGATNMVAGLQGSFGKLNALIAGVTAALAGGVAISSSVEATKTFTMEANKLARVLGVTATEASTLNVALGDIYTDADTFTGAAGKLAKELRINEGALKDLGLQTRDANGQLRPLKDLMLDSITVVNSYKQGVDRNIAAQVLWGKGAEEMSALLKLNNDVVEEARKKQEALGLVVGVESVAATKEYRAVMNDVNDVMLALKKAIGDAVMPVLTQLGEWFTNIGPVAVTVIKGAVGGLIAVFWGLRNVAVIVFETINALIITIAEPFRAFGAAVRKMLSGDMEGAANEFRNITTVWQHAWNNALISIGDTAEQTRERVGNLFGNATPVAATALKGKSAAGQLKPAEEKSQMPQWEAELNRQKQALADKNALEGTFFEFSLERERAFWATKRQLADAGSKDSFAIQAKVTAATLGIQKDAFEERLAQSKRDEALAEQDFKTRAALAQKELGLIVQRYGAESKQAQDAHRKIEEVERQAREQRRTLREGELAETAAHLSQQVELERQHQRFLFDAGLITRQQLLESEKAFELQRYEIQRQALQERQQLVDPTLNPVEYARIKNEILDLERQHQLQLKEIQNAATLGNIAPFRQMFSSIESGWANAIKGVLTGTQTITQGIKSLFKSVIDGVIGMLAQLAAKWMAQQLLMLVFGKTMGLSVISEKAAEAGAGGVASMAAAPWPLNMTAPAFGAAMSLAAMAFAPMASAAQGWDIPAGINPLVQTHAREMILPADVADTVRGAMGAGQSSGGGDTYHIHAMDTRSFEQFLRDNPAALAAGMQQARRRGFT